MSAEKAAVPADWFGHPRGLTILFLTDMWDQFSYYGMRTLLVYYMIQHLHFAQQKASIVYGLYTAFIYLTPIFGGLISDRWLGRYRAVLIGGSIMALGHFMMGFETLLYPALAAIGLGNGLFLPSLPSQINDLYSQHDPRRRTAYNIYYVGVNIGAFLAPFAVGTVGEIYGWHWGFTLAGFGMLTGLAIYVIGSRYLPRGDVPARGTAGSTLAATKRRTDPHVARRLALLFSIVMVVVLFRMTYEQVGNTVPLWIESADRQSGQFTIPMTWFQSLNPMFVFLLTPLLLAWWRRRAEAGRVTSSLRKMAQGAVLVAFAYLALAALAAWSGARGIPVGWPWLVVFFALMTLGELYILPVGLGLFGRLAPAGLNATVIALWFLAAFAGSLVAGLMGALWSHLSPCLFFTAAAIVAALAALLLFRLEAPVRIAAGE